MKRTSFAALTLLGLFATFGGPGCSADATPGTDTPSAGTATNVAGTSSQLPTAGTSSNTTAGTPSVGGSAPSTAGTAAGGTAAGGTAAGGSAAGGTAAGGSAAGGTAAGGSASGGASGAAGAGGGANPACPAKIDSATACTAVVSCPATPCGAFKLGARDCSCAAASGAFTCNSCSYAGKTESIVQPPAAALPACASDDTTLEKNTTGCTKGDRCKSLDTAKVRFCACWDDPVKATTVWDCDSMPSSWPM